MTDKSDEGESPESQRTVVSPGATPPPVAETAGAEGAAPADESAPADDEDVDVELDRARPIRVGNVLNHIFKVRRFIASGSTGEVFEGTNVNTDERVAIKVILPQLAADPTIQAMFRKEARTLTRLSHPALVQYRLLAQEPKLKTLYIVTEYIDGPSLADKLATLNPTPEQLTGLLRRVAEGLNSAHALGAIHRDISPENIVLENGDITRPRVIDFGIAKDLNSAAQTIIGTGFAGKLNYVAPEQLGDFKRDIGPWTDVYSLALTILSVALKTHVKMGASLVEAVDKRRAGVDVSGAPEALRPVLERMTQANPAERLRSMDAVIEMLDRPEAAPAPAAAPPEPAAQVDVPVPATPVPKTDPAGKADLILTPPATRKARKKYTPAMPAKRRAKSGGWRNWALVALAVLLAVLAVKYWDKVALLRGFTNQQDQATPQQLIPTVRTVVQTGLRDMPCSWLDLVSVDAEGSDISLQLRGVSGKADEAYERLEGLLKEKGLRVASIDFSDVSPIGAETCAPIEAFAKVRSPGTPRLTVAQRKFEMEPLPASAGADAGELGAEAIFVLDLGDVDEEVSLIAIDEGGEMQQLTRDRAELIQNSEPAGDNRYRFVLNTTHAGWSGIVMLKGREPFPGELLTSSSTSRGSDWAGTFLDMAKRQNWKTEMVWYRTVDDLVQ